MRCPICSQENRDAAKFCAFCHAPLTARCPRCGKDNRAGAKFCAFCRASMPVAAPAPPSPAPPPRAPKPRAGIAQLPWKWVGAAIAIVLIGCVVGIVGVKVFSGESATPTPAPTPSSTPSALASATPADTPSAASTSTTVPITTTSTPRPTPTPFAIVGPKRVDPTGATNNGIVVVDVESNAQYAIFSVPSARAAHVLSAAWSKDGKKLAVSYDWDNSDADFGHAALVMNEDGAERKDILKVTNATHGREARTVYGDAIWSPDGKKIAVRYRWGANWGIWLMNPDGSDFTRLASSHIEDWPRYWSEDGSWIIAVSATNNQLYGLAVEKEERVAFDTLKGTRLFDQRHYPWKVIEDPVCTLSGTWYLDRGAFWSCQ